MGPRTFLLVPTVLVILVEVLVSFQHRAPNVAWPVWFSFALITVNFFAYCLAGWLAVRRRQEGQLTAAISAGIVILVVEVIARSISVGLTLNSSDNDLIIMIKETFAWTSPLSSTTLTHIGIISQYIIFSPFYLFLSLLGGLMARRYFSSN
jgi:hypothetical protein